MVATRSKARTSTGAEEAQPKIDDALEQAHTGKKRASGGKGGRHKKRKTGDVAESAGGGKDDATNGESSHSGEAGEKTEITVEIEDSARGEDHGKSDEGEPAKVEKEDTSKLEEKQNDKVEHNASEKVEGDAGKEVLDQKSAVEAKSNEPQDGSGEPRATEDGGNTGQQAPTASTEAVGSTDAQEIQQAEKELAKNHNVVEYGRIHFLYKPKVEVEHPSSVDDVQRLHIVLQPHKGDDPSGKPVLSRMLHIGRKVLPPAGKGKRQPFWAFVSAVAEDVSELHEALKESKNDTKTKGVRTTGADRLIASGPYCIVSQPANASGSNPGRRTSFLCYTTTLPHEPGEVQKAFNIGAERSFTLSVKNPHYTDPPQAGLKEKAAFPEDLQSQMGDLRWHAVDPAAYLDYPNAELLFIAAHEDGISRDVGDEIAHELETIADEGDVAGVVGEEMHRIEQKIEGSIYDMLNARNTEKIVEGEESLIHGTWV